MCQWGGGANRNPWANCRIAHHRPHTTPLTLQTGGRKSPSQISANRLEVGEMPIEHILGYSGLLWIDAMNNRTAFAKAPNWVNADRAQYVVNHHCGDYLPPPCSQSNVASIIISGLLMEQVVVEKDCKVWFSVLPHCREYTFWHLWE